MTNVQLLNKFRNRQGWTIAVMFAAAKVMREIRKPKIYTASRNKFPDLYQALFERHGEQCSKCKREVPSVKLVIASKRKPLSKNPKLSEVRLLCLSDAIFFRRSILERKGK